MARCALLPSNEVSRQAAVDALALSAGAAAQFRLDDLAALAAEAFAAPMGLVSVADGDIARFLGRSGVEHTEIARDLAFCAHVVALGAPVIVLDALADPRFAHNPFVLGAPHVRFYAGAPILDENGQCLGAVCVADTAPRCSVDAREEAKLARFGQIAAAQLRGHGVQMRLKQALDARVVAEARAEAVLAEACSAFTACDRLAMNLDRRLRDALQRIQRQIEEMRPLCAEAGLRGIRLRVASEVAALWDMTDEMVAVARLDAQEARRGVEIFAPSPLLGAVVDGMRAAAADRGVTLETRDAAAGFEMLGYPDRFEDLMEHLLSDLVLQCEDAVLVVESHFEHAAAGGAQLALAIYADGVWETAAPNWRLSLRSRELIGAMAGQWDIAFEQRRLSVSVPARLRTPVRVNQAGTSRRTSTENERRGEYGEVSI